jgi:hypothetical protein
MPRAPKAAGVCLTAGCGQPVSSGRCPRHEHERDQARGSRQQRGYDTDYDRAKRDPAYLNATHCATCGKPFTATNPRTAGHTTDLRTGRSDGRIMPQCQDCNYGWRART